MDFRDLTVYKKAYELAMNIYAFSKSFPAEEKYALTDQIRRSSRAVCALIAEGYRKRIYPKYFISKIIDSDGENSETTVWLDFAFSCKYLSSDQHRLLKSSAEEIGRLLHHMISNPEKYCNK